MPSLHDPLARASYESRLRALTPDAQRRWGKMTPAQMLWHIDQALEMALGRGPAELMKLPIPVPRAVAKFIALYLPWPKGAPTAPNLKSRASPDFAAEQRRCLALIAECAAKPLDASWGAHVAFGALTGAESSRLLARHIDHHLRQFGV